MKTRLLFIAIAIACLLNADQAKWIRKSSQCQFTEKCVAKGSRSPR